MALFHLNAGIISRGKGNSITSAAAYISGEKLYDIYDGRIHDRSYRLDIFHKEILLPSNAPHELLNRQVFVNALNVAEKRSDAQMARTIKLGLPNELSQEEQITLVKEFVIERFIEFDMCADMAFHKGLLVENKKPISIEAVNERQDNPHVHIILPFRTVGNNGFHKTKLQSRSMNNLAYLISLRKRWAELQNREFKKLNLPTRISHESYDAQGIKRQPTKHIGASAMSMEKRGIQTERGDEYRKIINRKKEYELERVPRVGETEREQDFERLR